MEIVAAEAFDAQAVLCIYAPYIRQTAVTFETEVPGETEFARRIESISGEFPYLLLFADSELVGYAYAHRQAERAAYGWNAELSVYLRMDCRGRGMGRALYQLLIDLLAMQGYVNVYGVITGSNTPSIALHEKMGFAHAGVHEKTGYKFGQWHDVVWMHKRIGGDGAPGAIVRFDALNGEKVRRRIGMTCEEIEKKLGKMPAEDTVEDILALLDEIK
ncbi:MAG: N-acetyltransferase [Clostridia bacterium]|nr:N-acetyltransferase [Clostridia bacterium]